jgi:uncharacterized protein (DUF2062 family)
MIESIKKKVKALNLLEKYDISKRYFVVNKKMISCGVFIGLFIAMLPIPAQMLVVFAFSFVGKFNFPIAIIMCWITNPITMPFIYYIQYITGSFILGIEPTGVELTIEWFQTNFSKIIIPLYFGAFIYAISLATFAYYSILIIWKKE